MTKAGIIFSLLTLVICLRAEVEFDIETMGQHLGGWKDRNGGACLYAMMESKYRTYKPVITRTKDKGLYVSVRIDHVRGFLASDDYANLEISFDGAGNIQSAQSHIAIQGRTITSDVIRNTNQASGMVAPQMDHAVKMGSDLIADLTQKLLREKVVEAGRVTFPSVIKHNYHLICKSVNARGETAVPQSVNVEPKQSGGVVVTQELIKETADQKNEGQPVNPVPQQP
jgi:hypothetical protein